MFHEFSQVCVELGFGVGVFAAGGDLLSLAQTAPFPPGAIRVVSRSAWSGAGCGAGWYEPGREAAEERLQWIGAR